MKRIIVDTNFLLDLIRFGIDIEELESLLLEPYTLFIPQPALAELRRLAKERGRKGSLARLALNLIELKKINLLKSSLHNTDRAILQLATKDMIVATNDVGLRKELRALGTKTIYLRAKKHLALG